MVFTKLGRKIGTSKFARFLFPFLACASIYFAHPNPIEAQEPEKIEQTAEIEAGVTEQVETLAEKIKTLEPGKELAAIPKLAGKETSDYVGLKIYKNLDFGGLKLENNAYPLSIREREDALHWNPGLTTRDFYGEELDKQYEQFGRKVLKQGLERTADASPLIDSIQNTIESAFRYQLFDISPKKEIKYKHSELQDESERDSARDREALSLVKAKAPFKAKGGFDLSIERFIKRKRK